MNERERLTFVTSVCATLYATSTIVWAIVISPDPTGLLRYGLGRLAALSIALPTIVIFWLVIDDLTKGDWFDETLLPYQKTALQCAVVLAIAWVLVSA